MSRSRAASSLLLLSLAASALLAAEPWYEAYQGALKAVAARQWGVAETKLKAAMKDGPRPGRRVRTYGMNYVDFLPDYYLGLVYFNQQRRREALEQFRKVSASGLLAESDAEHRSLVDMMAKLEVALAPVPEPAKAPAETPRPAVEAPRAPPPEPPKIVTESPRASSPPAAVAPPPQTPSGAPQAAPRARPPEPPALPAPAPRRPAAVSPLELQRVALRAFFAGRYEESAQKLEEIAAGPGRSAPAVFYLGASHAALGLLREPGRAERLDRARRAFGDVRRLDPRFEADPGLVSPKILRIWRESRP
jgi:tetratricopeptide (TPR) repeat protein